MTTKAIEAGALAIAELRGAIWTRDKSKPVSATFDYDASKACIEAAIASGELVPADRSLRQRLDHLVSVAGEIVSRLGCAADSESIFEAIDRLKQECELVPASAVAAERERCAARCDSQEYRQRNQGFDDLANVAKLCAAAIRALEPASGECSHPNKFTRTSNGSGK